MFAWGALKGYASANEYSFNIDNYRAQGLNQISSDLSEQEDAASIYYGGIAQMPTVQDFTELIAYTDISRVGNIITIRSKINDNLIKIYARGEYIGTNNPNPTGLYIWSKSYYNSQEAEQFLVVGTEARVTTNDRERGMLILPIRSN